MLGYASLPDTPPLAPVTARVRERNAAQPQRAAPRPGGARLPRDDQFQLRRGALGARAGGQRRSDPRAQPDRQPAGGDALVACSAAWSTCCASTWRARPAGCASSKPGGSIVRDASARRRRRQRRRRQPADARRRRSPTGRRRPLQWGTRERAVDFFDIKGDVELLLAPRGARFVPATHPALHPGRCAAVELDGARIGFVGELHPKWRQAYELPLAPLLFELDASAARAARRCRPSCRSRASSRPGATWR